MPRNVRNFWLELTVDGQKTKVAMGPVKKDGGFELTIKIRDKGSVVHAGVLRGTCYTTQPGEPLNIVWDGPAPTLCDAGAILARSSR